MDGPFGDLAEWPLSPQSVHQIVRVRMSHGQEDLLNKFKELTVRTTIVKQIARIYIENHVQDLADRPGVLKIHEEQGKSTVVQSLHCHAERRIDEFYPEVEYPADEGGVMPELKNMVRQQTESRSSTCQFVRIIFKFKPITFFNISI